MRGEQGMSLTEITVMMVIMAVIMTAVGSYSLPWLGREEMRGAGRREPIEIAPTVPPDASARWGVFRNLDNPATPARAILIRKDARTGRWRVGDGRAPIATEPPPALAPGTRPVPVWEAGGGPPPASVPG